ncbi:8204_t:CDS:1 [Funneliformis caledonium]|uniref:8204_t:CDS:1 n=1 Tax=Funneliformis caledonium TaxID=1117310 RepID=A0A9N9DRT5_9GLOM|nr:8204_t:CDS:1 [Funneliformis caledonium]
MALIKEYRKKNIKLPPMGQFSKITKQSWSKETENVKDFYINLAKDAKSHYMENKTIQFVFDRHMSDSHITTGDAEYYVDHSGSLSLENSTISVTNFSDTISTANPNYNENNLIASYQRHIYLLEQLNNNLFDILELTQD